ncbi:MAG: MBL fold metallo-hydrolase [Dehalococcoidales bacterium]|nr:MBL fold metallo-hydrolase [Dehalococcoidales bacterium]
MKIKWLGHASFLITSDKGIKIITDPYTTGGPLAYGEITEAADIVTVSHGHGDHNNPGAVRGNPQILKGSATVKGIDFQAIAVFHDEANGSKRGTDTIFCFQVDGVKVCHLGDLGHALSQQQVDALGRVDVLLIPVGGYYTIDVPTATRVAGQLKPKVIIPMHYKTDKCTYPITVVDDFLKGKQNVKKPDASEVELRAGGLPAETQIIVLKHAL